MSYRRSSLISRLLVVVGAVGLVIFVVLSIGVLQSERSREIAAEREAADEALRLSTPPIAAALWNLDRRLIGLHLNTLVGAGAIVSASVVDTEGKVLVQAERPGPVPRDGELRELLLTGPAGPKGKPQIGALRVVQSSSGVDARTRERMFSLLAVELVKVAVVVTVLLAVGHQLVTRRLQRLVTQIESLPARGEGARVQVEASAAGADDEVAQLAQTINRFLDERDGARRIEQERDRADAASRAKSAFLSRMSHELRTPLNGIVGLAQALEKDPVVVADPRRAEYVQLIGRAGWHLAGLINDVLDLSRIESGNVDISTTQVDLRALASTAASLVESSRAQAQVALQVQVDAGAQWVSADPMRLQQVLLNLLTNAIKYNRPGGQVRLHARPQADGRVAVEVDDDGIGMDAAQQAMLFQPFNRLGRQNEGYGGTGIGLVITKMLVEMMRGALEVHSEPGRGSTFRFTLEAAQAPAAPAPQPVRVQVPGGHGRVVYVEDDAVNVEVMRALLASRPRVTLDIAGDIASGLQAVRREPLPGLVLLDMQLPDGPGITLLAAMRADPVLAQVPVVVVSADAMTSSVAAAMQMGALAYLSKPFDFDSTLQQIDALLR